MRHGLRFSIRLEEKHFIDVPDLELLNENAVFENTVVRLNDITVGSGEGRSLHRAALIEIVTLGESLGEQSFPEAPDSMLGDVHRFTQRKSLSLSFYAQRRCIATSFLASCSADNGMKN